MERYLQEAPLVPDSPEALHSYIVDELGDTELAERVAEYPELTKEVIAGEGLPSKNFFDMMHAIGRTDPALAKSLLEKAAHHDRLLPLSYSRVVGSATEDEKSNFLLHRRFVATEDAATPNLNEQEKNKEEHAVIEYADAALNALRASYGLDPAPLSPEQVHIVTEKGLPPERLGKMDLNKQRVRVLKEEGSEHFDTIIHELIHLKSYGSMQLEKKDERLAHDIYRLGLAVGNRISRGESKVYLDHLNEAVVEERANRLLRDIPDSHPVLGPEVYSYRRTLSNIVANYPDDFNEYRRPYWITGFKRNEDGSVTPRSSYGTNRQMMFRLLDKIYERNPEKFAGKTKEQSQEEMFVMLEKGAFTGNILPFGRLFNNTFGLGKFREFGHIQSLEDQQKFVENL